jgi:hypothetical protein
MRTLLLLVACAFRVGPIQMPEAPPMEPVAAPDLSTLPDLAPDLAGFECDQDCRLDVPGGTVVCAPDVRCEVNCSGSCNVVCGEDAKCSCKGAGCSLSGCTPMKCHGDALVCNQGC